MASHVPPTDRTREELPVELSRRTFSTLAGTAALGFALGGGSGGSGDAYAAHVVPTGPPPAPPGADGRPTRSGTTATP